MTMRLAVRATILAALCWLLAGHAPAMAQQPGCASSTPSCVQISAFTPIAISSLNAGPVSSSLTLPVTGQNIVLVVTNPGPVQTNVALGNSTVTVTPTTGTPIPPGQTVCLPQGLSNTMAAITPSATVPLAIQSGSGSCPTMIYGTFQFGGTLGAVTTKPGSRAIIPLDVSVVTTGGTAVTALTAGHAAAGGFIVTNNPAGMCVDQSTTAGTVNGTPSTTVCVLQFESFPLTPNGGAVSVNSTGSGVAISGQGWN
jgi:hypothetical protein